MPEARYKAFAITMSGRGDIPLQVHEAVIAWFRKSNAVHWAACVEYDDNQRLHHHSGAVFRDGKKASNVKTCLRYPAVIREWETHNSKQYAIKVKPMYNTDWFHRYLTKAPTPGSLKTDVDLLPDDLAELQMYFPTAPVAKVMNPEFVRWTKQYLECAESPWYELPATEDSVTAFFHYMMYCANLLKIITDQKRLKDRALCLVAFINQVQPDADFTPYHGLQHANADKPNVWKDKYIMYINSQFS